MELSSQCQIRPEPLVTTVDSSTTNTTIKHRKRKPTPDDYAKAVNTYALRPKHSTLYPGSHYQHLALYLKSKNKAVSGASSRPPYPFAVLHNLVLNLQDQNRVLSFSEILEFESFEAPKNHAENGQILILRGHPMSEWIKTAGAKYKIDAELFRRQLLPKAGSSYFEMPTLPSISDNIITLRIISIGKCTRDTLGRTESRRALEDYGQSIKGRSGIPGDSIVRKFYWHNQEYFSLEQQIIMTIRQRDSSWIGMITKKTKKLAHLRLYPAKIVVLAFVLTDVGRSLEDCPRGPWFRDLSLSDDVFLPTIQMEPGISLKNSISETLPLPAGTPVKCASHQSASLLPFQPFGARGGQIIEQVNPLSALCEIFTFAAAGVKQFLNLIALQVQSTDQHSTSQNNIQVALESLLYHIDILEDYVDYFESVIVFLQNRKTLWFNCSSERTLVSTSAADADRLQSSFEHLQAYAKVVVRRAQDKINNIRSTIVIEESRGAFAQQKSLASLTRLAFLFIPLSFATSFFGMNFVQFGTGNQHIWLFFVLALPLLVFSMVLLFLDQLRNIIRAREPRE